MCDDTGFGIEFEQTAEDITLRCDNCAHWQKDGYTSDKRRICRGFQIKQEMFSNDGCSNDFIYCTAPDFFCALFE